MSGKVRVWPNGSIVIETDEPVVPESIEMIARSIRERSLLVLGKGWTLEHESDAPPDFGMQWKIAPPDPVKWHIGEIVLGVGIGTMTTAAVFAIASMLIR